MEVEDSQNGLDDENSTLPEESQEGEEDENSNSESNLFGDENSNSLKPDDSQLISGEVKENEAKKNEEGVVHEIPESSVRKWKKKWITVEHMKLLKWVPVGAPRDVSKSYHLKNFALTFILKSAKGKSNIYGFEQEEFATISKPTGLQRSRSHHKKRLSRI